MSAKVRSIRRNVYAAYKSIAKVIAVEMPIAIQSNGLRPNKADRKPSMSPVSGLSANAQRHFWGTKLEGKMTGDTNIHS
jgi:hypothetical protein